MLIFLDWFFTIFHTLFTLFNIFGWIHFKTRKLHLMTVSLTVFSWVVMGYFYGFGYCFLTDWHYKILYELGYNDLPYSYITFLIKRLTGLSINDELVINITMWVFTIIVLLTITLQIKEMLNKRKK